MLPVHRVNSIMLVGLSLLLLSGCSGNAQSLSQSTQTLAATPDPAFATPQPVLTEEPLQGQVPDIPNILVVRTRQSKTELAAFLKTTSEQLNWANPGISDQIDPDSLIVIPPIYRTAGETIQEVSKKTSLPEELLSEMNPQFAKDEILKSGTILLVPSIYIVTEDTLLSKAADLLNVNDDALLSANPELIEKDELKAGTVLTVPAPKKD